MKESTKDMLKSVTQWLAMNAFFAFFLLVFAGLAFGLMSFSKWITEGAIFEVQYFSGMAFGITAVALTLWLMFMVIKLIERKK